MKTLLVIGMLLIAGRAKADFNNYQSRYQNESGAYASAYANQRDSNQNVYVSPYSQGGVQMNTRDCAQIVVPNSYGGYSVQTRCR